MSVHTYVGARYVPRFLGTYDPTQIYDALDVVDNGSGTSYIARKTVPAGTPLTDTDHWFVYGASSGAIIALQNDMIQAQNDIININNEIDNIEAEFTPLNRRKFIILADSYGNRTNSLGKNLGNIFTDKGLDIAYYQAISGAGLNVVGDPTLWLPSYLANYTGDHNEITDVVYICSANDNQTPYSTMLADIGTSISTTKTSCPNARITLIPAGVIFADSSIADILYNATIPAYHDAVKFGAYVAENAEYMLRNTKLLAADMIHPNADGVDYLAEKIYGYLNGQPIDVYHVLTGVTLTAADADISTSTPSTIKMVRHNGNVSITRSSAHGILGTFSFPAQSGLLIAYTHAFDLSDSLISFPQSGTRDYVPISGRFENAPGSGWSNQFAPGNINTLIYDGTKVRISMFSLVAGTFNAIQSVPNTLYIND